MVSALLNHVIGFLCQHSIAITSDIYQPDQKTADSSSIFLHFGVFDLFCFPLLQTNSLHRISDHGMF